MGPDEVNSRTNPRSDSNINDVDVIVNHRDRRIDSADVITLNKGVNATIYDNLVKEGREFFLEYIDWRGLQNMTNMIVLPDSYHYYYDLDDLAEVETIINLKPLNSEKRVGNFLESIADSLPFEGNLLGCFVENNTNSRNLIKDQTNEKHNLGHADLLENGIISSNQVFNRIINIMDSRIFRRLTESNVRKLLSDRGFIVENMTEINGITYFHSRKSSRLA